MNPWAQFLLVLHALRLWLVGNGQLLSVPCRELARAGDCNFYLCLDRQLGGCGKGSYLSEYGYKYCNRFTSLGPLFTFEGQEWVEGVRGCLMNTLLNVYVNFPPSEERAAICHRIATEAMRSHEACYVGNGFCQMVTQCRNIEAFHQVVEFSDCLPYVSTYYWETITHVYRVLSRCPKSTRNDLSNCISRCPDNSLSGAILTAAVGAVISSCESPHKAAVVFVADGYANSSLHEIKQTIGTLTNHSVFLLDILYTGKEAIGGVSAVLSTALELLMQSSLCSSVSKLIVVVSDLVTKVDTELTSMRLLAAKWSGIHVCLQASYPEEVGGQSKPSSYLVLPDLNYEPVLSCGAFLASLV